MWSWSTAVLMEEQEEEVKSLMLLISPDLHAVTIPITRRDGGLFGGAGRTVFSQLCEAFFGCRLKCRKAISCEAFNHQLAASDLSPCVRLNCGLIDQSCCDGMEGRGYAWTQPALTALLSSPRRSGWCGAICQSFIWFQRYWIYQSSCMREEIDLVHGYFSKLDAADTKVTWAAVTGDGCL